MVYVSDRQEREWLTTEKPPILRFMIDTVDDKKSWQAPNYSVTKLQRQIDQPSLGSLEKLPPELLCMVMGNLTCKDLEAFHSCSTGGRIAVLAFPKYHRLLEHEPTIFTILKKTRLAGSFTITKIYETFASTLCSKCGQYGGYVFLPSFTRCCIHCAETELEFLPISRDGAGKQFGVKGKSLLDNVPQLRTLRGYYSSLHGKTPYYKYHPVMFSREAIRNVRCPGHRVALARHRQSYIGDHSIKAHQRYMAIIPFSCYISKSASLAKALYCAGCALRAWEHLPCERSDWSENRRFDKSDKNRPHITDGLGFDCSVRVHRDICSLSVARDRAYDSRHILSHIEGCVSAQVLLKKKWAQYLDNIPRKSTGGKRCGKR